MRLLKWIIISVLLAGCNFHETKSVKDNVLVYCSEGSPETFNPQLSTSNTTFDASSRPIYNRLIEFKPESTTIQPSLATNWEVSKDGKSYTFNLRKGVRFHSSHYFQPEREFNADDVIFSFERQKNNDHPFHNISSLKFGYFDSMGLDKLINRIEKLDDYTVRFILNRAESPFLSALAMDFASILSAEYGEHLLAAQTPEFIDVHPVGTGPFQLDRYQPDAFIRYKANPDYWEGKQLLAHVIFAITPEPSLRFARMLAGDCDIMAKPLPIHIKAAQKHDNIQVISQPGLNIAYLAMNTQKPPFNNQLVRVAINHAINKNSIIKAVYRETATKAKSPVPPNMWSYDQSLIDYQYNPELAKELLLEAGFSSGFKMNIVTTNAQRSYNPNAKKMAELIQQDLKKVNIQVNITSFEFGKFLSYTSNGLHQSALAGWVSDNGDPDNFFSTLLSCNATHSGTNAAFWCDHSFSELTAEARSKSKLNERLIIYKTLQKTFKEAAPWVPIAHATQHFIVNSRIKNFKIASNGGAFFTNVYLDNSNKKSHNGD